ncbi:MAG: dihydroorotate dehydrogenase electron transfer subunit [Lachnospiraceae bacterium]|nr:dihydroorotate dehydrogenase electron transfer subunit [Lachnospiraceae bacterium]
MLAKIESQKEIAKNIFDLRLLLPAPIQALPGQFMLLYPEDGSLLLPRPISICEVLKNGNLLRLIYRATGKGTLAFARLSIGDSLRLEGPRGNGFPLEGDAPVLIGGGIGIFPLLELAKRFSGNAKIILGYQSPPYFLAEDFAQHGEVFLSVMEKEASSKEEYPLREGTVMEWHEEIEKAGTLFACGPAGMLRAIKEFAMSRNIPAWLSLEERMACGIGACLGCVTKTANIDAHSQVKNARVCREGPVFPASEVYP